ncbi:MAG: nicotinate (nicotinamide) nucleotide adenylyltransferase [Methylophilaceae bacterium]|nr:nicotinate (nicotinamide) nucleotide adenylyltransferase [Methylophilaceae bacterium]MBL6726461.1 nicotinate (nicotinamide) nucleotide adenylyltransferase [Methylophilaceae bacterium]MBL6728713.1 nicotinate (nicotinamide) nucleotide adenylyltransferase [Methylophilaceae bacterium]MBL6791143.1 nicotinate (nicotinamide) nucleotide adenylyltransferase [Methylophilaceae bacterium]
MAILNVALFGGAFDPVHNGHLHIANTCLTTLTLDKMVIMPTGESAFRKPLSPAYHRVQMLKRAFSSKIFEIDEFEINSAMKKQPSYTVSTLKYLLAKCSSRLFLILGADTFSSFHKWYQFVDIIDYCHIIIINRNQSKIDEVDLDNKLKKFTEQYVTESIKDLQSATSGKIFFLNIQPIEISSTEIKNKIFQNKSVSTSVPIEVAKYIEENKLYASSSGQEK